MGPRERIIHQGRPHAHGDCRRNADLKGLPPVTLISATIDPLRSDADMLKASLEKAGVKVMHTIYEGVTHEFFGMAAVVPKAKDAQKLAGTQLKESLVAKRR